MLPGTEWRFFGPQITNLEEAGRGGENKIQSTTIAKKNFGGPRANGTQWVNYRSSQACKDCGGEGTGGWGGPGHGEGCWVSGGGGALRGLSVRGGGLRSERGEGGGGERDKQARKKTFEEEDFQLFSIGGNRSRREAKHKT